MVIKCDLQKQVDALSSIFVQCTPWYKNIHALTNILFDVQKNVIECSSIYITWMVDYDCTSEHCKQKNKYLGPRRRHEMFYLSLSKSNNLCQNMILYP